MKDAAPMRALIEARLTRRALLGGAIALPLLSYVEEAQTASPAPKLPNFAPVAATVADRVTVPEGFQARTLIAWGDPLFESTGPFDPDKLTRAEQEQRFGANNDMVAIFPGAFAFPWPTDQDRLLFCVNHEYFEPALMFPSAKSPGELGPQAFAAMYASMGVSVLQVAHQAGGFQPVRDPAPGKGLNRRVTPFTPVIFEGPAKHHRWIAEAAAVANAQEPGGPAGTVACGTLANCAGGVTPWGTYLTAEENFQSYFGLSDVQAPVLKAKKADATLLLDAANFGYRLLDDSPFPAPLAQFDLAQNPTGPALYGWIVEIDPYDPTWIPRKRTALGRRKSECANTVLTKDGRVAVYSGDDQIDEFIYKFVSRRRFDPANRIANRDLLDDGQLYVARFDEEGDGEWIPLKLAAANAAAKAREFPHLFKDEADLMMRARDAARFLGATPMDRPEDVEAPHRADWTGLGSVFMVCTNNAQQGFARGGNPRREDPEKPGAAQPNRAGHILRIDEQGDDHAALRFKWDVFVLCGDPGSAAPVTKDDVTGQRLHVSTAVAGKPTFTGDRFACPDNICFDSAHNVWIATDGSDGVFGDCNDAVLVTSIGQAAPRQVKRFLVGPMGSEICGPHLAPDESAFFCAIQHPGENDAAGTHVAALRWGQQKPPPSTFPDGGWPRSAVVYVTRNDGAKVNR